MVSESDARRAALDLPGTVEQDHHGRPSFRVKGKIFATLWDGNHLNVMVRPERIGALVNTRPDVFSEVWWGKRLAAVRVDLGKTNRKELAGVLAEAWHQHASSAAERRQVSRKV